MIETIFQKLGASIADPVSLVLLLGMFVFYRLFMSEREERQTVQSKRDEIATLYHEQGKSLLVLLESIRGKLK